jgi:hypothetical protein
MVNGGLGKIWKKVFVAYFSVIFHRFHGMAEENEELKNILRNMKPIPPVYMYKAILLH